MPADYSTNTEAAAGISAAFDAYPDRDLDRPSPAELEELAEWHRAFPDREPTGEMLPAFDRAVAAVADRDPGTDWGEEAHQRVMARLREEGAL